MTVFDSWLSDLPQQFLGQTKIETLIAAFARQLQELETVFSDINEKTNLETACGKNLDYVGSVISLTRKEAAVLAGAVGQTLESGASVDERLPNDEQYRRLLKYRLLFNTNECTYYDLMEGASLLLDTKLYYSEDKNKPATIILKTPSLPLETDFSALMNIVFIRPAGVGLRLEISAHHECESASLRLAPVAGDTYIRLTIPPPRVPDLYALGVLDGILYQYATSENVPSFAVLDGVLYVECDEDEEPPYIIENGVLYEEVERK